MAKIDIDSTTTPNIWQLADQAPALEIYADEPFDNTEGQTILQGDVNMGDCCKRVVGSVASNVLSFPKIEQINTTEDSLTNQAATYSAYIKAAGREPIPWLLGFSLAPITVPGVTSVNWTSVRIHAAGVTPRRTNEVYTKQQTDAAIAAALLALGLGGGVITAKGTVVMAAGVAVVVSNKTLIDSIILLTGQEPGVNGTLYVNGRTPGVGFTIGSTNGADGGNVGWAILFA